MTRISCGENCPSVELNLEKMITNAKEIEIESHKECNISCETHTVLTFFLAIRFGPLLRSAPNFPNLLASIGTKSHAIRKKFTNMKF